MRQNACVGAQTAPGRVGLSRMRLFLFAHFVGSPLLPTARESANRTTILEDETGVAGSW
jgi:hypothetical protein